MATTNSQPTDGSQRAAFLARLPLLLNSSLNAKRVVEVALSHLKRELGAEAATVFLVEPGAKELEFWALSGEEQELCGQRMPLAKGIVGWVLANLQSVLSRDVARDPRFFGEIDHESGFKTRDLICVPLLVRGDQRVGAIELLNSCGAERFSEEDLAFVEQVAHQLALAIDNARLHQALQERNRKLELLDRRKDEMLSVIAHEFRTPLTLVQGAAEMITSGIVDDAKTLERLAETLQNGVTRLTRLIGEIRNVPQATSDQLKVRNSRIEVPQLITAIEQRFQQPLADRKLNWSVSCDGGASCCWGDQVLVSIALGHLIANAIRFTPDGGTIALRVSRSGGLIGFEVSDTGIGIPADQIPAIFEKFYEVCDAMEHSSGTFGFRSAGLGLGLATVQSILKAHGAQIRVESAPGSGSKFLFHLPADEAIN